MQELNIPKDHYNKFKSFLSLPKEMKENMVAQLKNAPVGLSPTSLTNYISTAISNLPKEEVNDVLTIYFNLIKAKERINADLPDFLEILKTALKNTEIDDLNPTAEVITDFEHLLSSSTNFLITTKVIELMAENSKTFVDTKIFQDIRPTFDANDNLLGSGIIHTLKLIFEEDSEIKETYLSLEDNDLEKFISVLKKAQDKSKVIKAQFENFKIIKMI
jgi:hypothetical protein